MSKTYLVLNKNLCNFCSFPTCICEDSSQYLLGNLSTELRLIAHTYMYIDMKELCQYEGVVDMKELC